MPNIFVFVNNKNWRIKLAQEIVKQKYQEIMARLESSPKKSEIIRWWNDHTVDIVSYLRFQFMDENNILPVDVLEPEPDKIIKIRLKGFEYYVPMKDVAHMGDGNREPWLIKELSVLKEGDVFVDVGANLGLFTVPAGKRARVFAFEPDDDNYNILQDNLKLNNVGQNVTVIKEIVTDHIGNAEFYTSSYGIFSTMIDPSEQSSNWEALKKSIIPTVTLDAFVKRYSLDRIDWIKIDIEGAEVLALKGCAKTLEDKVIRNFLIEMHAQTFKGTEQEEIYSMLSKSYSIKILWRDKNNPAFHYLKASLK